MTARRWLGVWLPGVGAALFLFVLAARTGGGVFGTDEYWYAGDLRMTAATGDAIGNHVYPLFADTVAPGSLPPRMHDVPVTHLASLVYQGLGGGAGLGGVSPGTAWLVVNVTFALLIAAIVAFTARVAGGSGAWAPALFLVFPSTVWAALDPLGEMGLALGVAVLVAATTAAERTRQVPWWFAASAAVAWLVWSRTNFAIVAVGFVALVLWRWRRGALPGRHAAAVLGVTAALLAAVGVWSTGYPNAGFLATLMVGAPGASSNMDFYSVPVPFDAGTFASKFADGVWRALTPRTWSEALLPAPIALGCLAGLVAGRGDRRSATVRFWAVILLVTYLFTCGAFQPQGRYLYVAAPVAAILLDVAATRLWARGTVLRLVVTAVTVALVVAGAVRSVQVANVIYVAGRNAEAATSRLAAALDPALHPEGAAVMVITHGNAADIAVAYAAIPHPTLSVDPALLTPAQARRLAQAWGVRAYVGTPQDTAYVQQVAGPLPTPTPVQGPSRRATTTVWSLP